MPNFDDLFSDPTVALGYGLLSSRQNPIGSAIDMWQKAKKDSEKDFEIKQDTTTGQWMVIDKKSMKMAPFPQGGASSQMPGLTQPDSMPTSMPGTPSTSPDTAQPNTMSMPAMPPNLTPKGQMDFNNEAIKSNFKQSNEENKTDLKAVEDARTTLRDSKSMLNNLDEVKTKLDSANKYNLGPVMGRVSPLYSSDVQSLTSATNLLALQAKNLLKFPNNNFSDADREFLSKIAGGPTVNKDAAQEIHTRLSKMTNDTIGYNKSLLNHYNGRGSLRGFDFSGGAGDIKPANNASGWTPKSNSAAGWSIRKLD